MSQLNYQNPVTPSAVLDSETFQNDPTTGQEIRREYVIKQQGISVSEDPASVQLDLLQQILSELKQIRILLEQDIVPGGAEDEMDEVVSGNIQEEVVKEGIEEL